MKPWLEGTGWLQVNEWFKEQAWLRRRSTWVMVGLAILAVGFAIVWQVEHRKRIMTEDDLARTIQAKERVETKLSAEEQLSRKLSGFLEVKTEELQQVVKRLEDEAHTVERLQGSLVQMQSQMNQLQAELVLAMRDRGELSRRVREQPRGGSVELDKITVTGLRPKAIVGKIIQVNADWQFVVVDLGWDLLSVGDLLGVVAERRTVRGQRQMNHLGAALGLLHVGVLAHVSDQGDLVHTTAH